MEGKNDLTVDWQDTADQRWFKKAWGNHRKTMDRQQPEWHLRNNPLNREPKSEQKALVKALFGVLLHGVKNFHITFIFH